MVRDQLDVGTQIPDAEHHAFGIAGRAGGEDHIQRSSAYQCRGTLSEQRLVGSGLHDLFHHDDVAVILEGLCHFKMRLIHQQIRRLDDGEYLIESLLGHIAVHRRIEATRSDSA